MELGIYGIRCWGYAICNMVYNIIKYIWIRDRAFQMSNFKCQTSNINFQISKFKSRVGDNPSCATQQLIQKQVATVNISNFKCPISNVQFQMSNFKCQISKLKCQISDFKCQISNVKFQMSNFKCQISNAKYQMSLFKYQI